MSNHGRDIGWEVESSANVGGVYNDNKQKEP